MAILVAARSTQRKFGIAVGSARGYDAEMARSHPNEPGQWSLLVEDGGRSLWRRDRSDPYPVSQFYLIQPPAQAEIFYQEDAARARYDSLVAAAQTSRAVNAA